MRNDDGFGEVELFALLFAIALVAALGYGVVMGIYDLCCRPAPSPFQQWALTYDDRCRAMRSRLHLDVKAKTVECYRTPMFRKPKLMFKETFRGEGQ